MGEFYRGEKQFASGRSGNHIWGLDATGKTDASGNLHPILGIVDHGTRAAISLQPLRDLTIITILRALLDVIERFGKPKFLRTDNASQFHSFLFRFTLAALGIGQQFSLPGCPWQNGRVEKFFGTLKERLNQLAVANFLSLEISLAEIRNWYNSVRPHQHLGGRTPFEAWNKVDPYRRPPKEIHFATAWDGLLTSFGFEQLEILLAATGQIAVRDKSCPRVERNRLINYDGDDRKSQSRQCLKLKS